MVVEVVIVQDRLEHTMRGRVEDELFPKRQNQQERKANPTKCYAEFRRPF